MSSLSRTAEGATALTTAPTRGGYRVLMVAPTSFFADYGCHVRIREEARILAALGCRVTICTYHSGRDIDGLDIRRTLSIPWRKGYEVGSSRHKIAFDGLLFLSTLGVLPGVRPDVIHAHLHEGALIGEVLSRLFRVPMVFDYQGSLTSEMVDHHFIARTGRWFEPLRRLERSIDHAAPHILTSSANAAHQLVEAFGCPQARVTPIADCVDTEMFRPLPESERLRVRRAWGIPDGNTVVVYLGKLAEYQGTGHLLRAARLVCEARSDVHFVIGGYPYVDEYRAQAGALGIADRCTFTGRVDYMEDAPSLLAMGDIAASPKMSETEGAGKILNYMATGLPTVAFDGQVSREFLGELGIYARRGDVGGLAQDILDLVASPARRAELGAALRERAVTRFSWRQAGERLLAIYRAVGASPSLAVAEA